MAVDYADSFYKKLDFKALSYDDFVKEVRNGLHSYGMVIADNVSLSPAEYVALTARLGDPINLPNFLVPAKLDGHPEIARVANFDATSNEVNPNYAFGFYWHHDGNFWERGRNHIINMLYSHIVPEEGGKTGFLNTRKAYASLDSTIKEDLADVCIPINCNNIEDFKKVPYESWCNELPEGVSHPCINVTKDYTSLYIPFFNVELETKSGKKILHPDLMAYLDKPENLYMHSWSPNQIVFWDNTQYMHKAMGGIKGKRLLWRTQARMPTMGFE